MADLFAADTAPLMEQIAEVEREIRMREEVYGRRVKYRQMTQEVADRRIKVMRDVLATLRRAADAD